jgi:hypothetical protein
MSPKSATCYVLFSALLLGSTGCVQKLTGTAEPGVDLSQLKTFHVVQTESKNVTAALRDDLVARGFTVTVGRRMGDARFSSMQGVLNGQVGLGHVDVSARDQGRAEGCQGRPTIGIGHVAPNIACPFVASGNVA